MQKEQLLNLLDQQARDAFERAKQLALANGGLVTPLHIMVSVLQLPRLEGAGGELLSSLLQAAREAIQTRYPNASKSITISRETQTVLTEAGRLARIDGCMGATPAHLLRASARSQTVDEAVGEIAGLDQIAELVSGKASQQSSAGKPLDRESGDLSSRSFPPLTGVLNDYCCDVAADSRASASHPFVGRERQITGGA